MKTILTFVATFWSPLVLAAMSVFSVTMFIRDRKRGKRDDWFGAMIVGAVITLTVCQIILVLTRIQMNELIAVYDAYIETLKMHRDVTGYIA